MKYLTGVTNDKAEPAFIERGLGLMVQPGNSLHRRALRYPWWAADNGSFSDKWVEAKWMRWLELLPTERCLFAVAPDVYPDAAATLERSWPYFEIIRSLGLPVALVAQDGAENMDLPWDDFDCLFVGGERTPNPADEWKTSAAAEALVRRARNHGKWAHMGRVNSLERLRRAAAMGCQSADGTAYKYRMRKRTGEHPDAHLARGAVELIGWVEQVRADDNAPDLEAPSLPVHRSAHFADRSCAA